MSGFYDFTMKDIEGKDVSLSTYRGEVLLVVNVASRCGFTPQYEGLETLYKKYQERGFRVLGFPANNFLWQEPGSNEEIKTFCSTRYKVTFPIFSKISVKGKNQDPLYRWLTSPESNPSFSGKITWNFNKFLVGRNGNIIARFGTRQPPDSPEIIQAIETALVE